MSDLQVIQSVLEITSRRRQWQKAWTALWTGLIVGGLIWLLSLGLYKVLPLPLVTLAIGAAAGFAVTVGFAVRGLFQKPTTAEGARWLDRRVGLQERLSTALEVSDAHQRAEWRQLVLADAAQAARSLDLRRLLPWSVPRTAHWTLLVLALGAGLGFVPEYRSAKFIQRKRETENIKTTGAQLAELTRRSLESRPPALDPTRKSLESLAELGDQLARQPLTRPEALRDLATAADKLKQDFKAMAKDPVLKRMEQAARSTADGGTAPTPADLQKRIEEMEKALGEKAQTPGTLARMQDKLRAAQKAAAGLAAKDASEASAAREQLADSLAALSREAKDAGISLEGLDESIAALASGKPDQLIADLQMAYQDLEKLRDLAQKLNQLRQQAARTGKDLAEQLRNGQAQVAQKTLEKMIEQLKLGQLSPEQMQQMLREVAEAVKPADDYGKAAEFLQKAAEQLQAGEKPGAAQSLASAAKELDQLMKDLADAESLLQSLDNLEAAMLAVGTGQGMGACRKRGLSEDEWPGEGGSGAGTAAHGVFGEAEAKLTDDRVSTKVKGQISPGAPMPSITLKGVSIKGASTIQFQEAATAAQADAQSALNQDKVPRAYQNAVKEYFNDLKK